MTAPDLDVPPQLIYLRPNAGARINLGSDDHKYAVDLTVDVENDDYGENTRIDAFEPIRAQLKRTDFQSWDSEMTSWLIQNAPEWEMLQSAGVKTTPERERAENGLAARLRRLGTHVLSSQLELVDSGTLTEEQAIESSIDERVKLSAISSEVWRTSASEDVLDILRRGRAEDIAWMRPPQEEAGQLREAQYQHFVEGARKAMGNYEGYMATQVIMLLHDIGKSDIFAARAKGLGVDVDAKDHDALLRVVMENSDARDQLLPTLAALHEVSKRAYDMVIKVLTIDANYSQLLQGEAPAGAMDGLMNALEAEGMDEQIRDLYFLHAKLDTAGVRGDVQQAGTVIFDRETYQDTVDLEEAITSAEIDDNPDSRYHAYLRKRGERLGIDFDNLRFKDPELDERPLTRHRAYALVRLAIMQRMHSEKAFSKLVDQFYKEEEAVQAIYDVELNKTGIHDKAVLHIYSPATLRALANNPATAESYLTMYATLLHEACLADAQKNHNDTRLVYADLHEFAETLNNRSRGIGSPIRFEPEVSSDGSVIIVPKTRETALTTFEGLGEYTTGRETFEGQRTLLVAANSGADRPHARVIGQLFAEKYGANIVGLATIHQPGNDRTPKGYMPNTPGALPHGSYLAIPPKSNGKGGKDEEPSQHTIALTTDLDSFSLESGVDNILTELRKICQEQGIDRIIHVDPGGDSLRYAGDYEGLPPYLRTVQDHAVMQALHALSRGRRGQPKGIPSHTVSIGPSLYAHEAAKQELLVPVGAKYLQLHGNEKQSLIEWFTLNGMLDTKQSTFSTTAALFAEAARDHLGVQSLHLPGKLVIDPISPRRLFWPVYESSGEIIIFETGRFYTKHKVARRA